ncbi:MAG: substrate-binding domain-containing protein [Bacilli bacterium]
MNKKLVKQISVLTLMALTVAVVDTSVYFLFTNRSINNLSQAMQAKSIEVGDYIPFQEGNKNVTSDSGIELKGNLPVVDGAAALLPVFSSFVQACYPENSVSFENGDFTSDSALQFHNTRGSYQGIVDKTADIVFCAKPNQAQLDYASSKGVELELTPIGHEAFVFLVNKGNPVDNLSCQQVKDIFNGKYTNWNQVGGPNRPTNPLQRNEGSGSQTALENFLGSEVKTNPLGFIGGSIGFSFRYYVETVVDNGNVKMLSLDSYYPDRANIRNGNYPIINDIYAVTRKDETNENVDTFLSWILSPSGQSVIEDVGYVGV